MNEGERIVIENLTDEQVNLLDVMWHIDSTDEFLAWYDSLDPADRDLADDLTRLVIMELHEKDLKEFTDYSEANEVLKKFML